MNLWLMSAMKLQQIVKMMAVCRKLSLTVTD